MHEAAFPEIYHAADNCSHASSGAPKFLFKEKYAFGVGAAHISFDDFPKAARSHQLRLDGVDKSICEVGVSFRRELHFCPDRASRLDETRLLTLVCSCAARCAVARQLVYWGSNCFTTQLLY